MLPLLREKLFWAPLYLFVVAFVALNFRRGYALRLLVGLLITVAVADSLSSQAVKKTVKRLRPCNDPVLSEAVMLRAPCGGGYSFTSSHAANHFAVAVFLGGFLGMVRRWIRPALLAWAASVAFAQVYVGVHYPLDVLCGALLGIAVGWSVYRALRTGLQPSGDPAEPGV